MATALYSECPWPYFVQGGTACTGLPDHSPEITSSMRKYLPPSQDQSPHSALGVYSSIPSTNTKMDFFGRLYSRCWELSREKTVKHNFVLDFQCLGVYLPLLVPYLLIYTLFFYRSGSLCVLEITSSDHAQRESCHL